MSDQEIVFGTPEHIAGLSRKALEEDFRWVQDRRTELEGECERLEGENAKLRELATAQCECVKHDDCSECVHYSEGKCMFPFKVMHRELGIEVEE